MKATSKRLWALVLTLAAVLTLLTGCMSGGVEDEAQANQAQTPANQGPVPQIPQQLTLVEGVPQLTVYDVDSQSYRQMDMETYVCGVLAGEMQQRLAHGGAEGPGYPGAHLRPQVHAG